ncbi:MAG TPA: hypothetical protein EYP67_00520 [Methanosarcinales archaeon]|nr:hypothetical protein [Methanosarcinales archaeon]
MVDRNADKKIILEGMVIMIMVGYTVIWSIGCSPMAVLAHETLGCAGIDSRIAIADVAGMESYGHYYIMVDGRPCEPRYIGLYLQSNIDYSNPLRQYNSTADFLNDGNDLLPSVALIIDASCERAGLYHGSGVDNPPVWITGIYHHHRSFVTPHLPRSLSTHSGTFSPHSPCGI